MPKFGIPTWFSGITDTGTPTSGNPASSVILLFSHYFPNTKAFEKFAAWFQLYPCDTSYARKLAVVMCLSVTCRYCITMAKQRITQTTKRDSPGTLSFLPPTVIGGQPPTPVICVQSNLPPF